MGLWSKGVARNLEKIPRLEDCNIPEIRDWLEGQSEIESIEIVDAVNSIINVNGSLEIYLRDLDKGELPFKVKRLTGDLILVGRGRFKKSIIPDQLDGDIIIRFEKRSK